MSKADIYKILGNNIRVYREELKLSQEELAFLIKSARNYIGCIERAEKHASLSTVYKIASALNKKVEDLVRGF